MIYKVFDNLVPDGWAEFQEWSVGECIWYIISFCFFFILCTLHCLILILASIRDCGRE